MKLHGGSHSAVIILVLFASMTNFVNGHGRLRDPPSRSSAWREGFKTPPDYNDTEGFCGGFERQWLVNKGKCGICGDAFDELVKPHEAPGGVFATGTIVRNYTEGQVISLKIDITALHKGYYEFKICPNNNINRDPPQSCFDKNRLTFVNGAPFARYDVSKLTQGLIVARLQLPRGLTCSQCILQWTYVTGNSWGTCSNGTQGLACGPQETYRACSDIGIASNKGSDTSVATSPPPLSTTPMNPPITSGPVLTTPPTASEIPSVPTVSSTTITPCTKYVPVLNQRNISGIAEWCTGNCPNGFCPSNYCVCDKTESN